MGEYFLRIYACLSTKAFHFPPNISAAHRLATLGYEDRTGRNLLLCCIAEQFLLQFSDNEYRACFTFKRNNRFTALYRFYRDILQFADTDTCSADCLISKFRRLIAFFLAVPAACILLWLAPFLRDSRSAVVA